MATWTLTINNAANKSTNIYVMEDDETGSIVTPSDLFYPLCFGPYCESGLAKRFLYSFAIGGDAFPPVCKEVRAGSTGTVIVEENTKALKIWTYEDFIWKAQVAIKEGIAKGATISVPSYEKEEEVPRR